jgi:hypothetical protein
VIPPSDDLAIGSLSDVENFQRWRPTMSLGMDLRCNFVVVAASPTADWGFRVRGHVFYDDPMIRSLGHPISPDSKPKRLI